VPGFVGHCLQGAAKKQFSGEQPLGALRHPNNNHSPPHPNLSSSGSEVKAHTEQIKPNP